MGRYYTGDIEGKFWFAIQSSDDASFFGGSDEDTEDGCIEYFFQSGDLEEIAHGIKMCEEELGSNLALLSQFFDTHESYNFSMIEELLGVNKDDAEKALEWYARLILGRKIYECVRMKGTCTFSAEL
jgi:hypothetical protein